MADQGTPYHTDLACNCNNCRVVYEGHNLSPIGTDLRCRCYNCTLRRNRYSINGPEWPQDRPILRTTQQNTRGNRKSMATINMCERTGCESMMKSNAAGVAQIQSNATYGSNGAEIGFVFDGELCPGCIGDIVALLNTPPTTERRKAYDKPWSEAEATKSDSPFSGLSDQEIAAELLTRRGTEVARELTERPQDDATENPVEMPRNVTRSDGDW